MNEVFRVGIIDDQSAKATQIYTSLLHSSEVFTDERKERYSGVTFSPVIIEIDNDLMKMTDKIVNEKLHAVIIDYKLSSFGNVSYTGIDIAKKIEEYLYDFPLFILTSYENDLFIHENFNVYQVFDFHHYQSESREKSELHSKIIEKIIQAKKQQEIIEEELWNLLPDVGKSAQIDSKIMELDFQLERYINRRLALPKKTRQDLCSSKVDVIINKLDEILKKEE